MSRRTLYGADKNERLAVRAALMPKDARCILEHENGSACYAYEAHGRLYAIAFFGTAGRPSFHYSYRTEERRNQAIWEFKQSVEASIAFRAKAKAERKAQPCTLKIGEILNTCWGYDQTNVDFFVVTRISGKRVYVRPIAADYEATGYMQGKTWPAMPIRMTGEETAHTARGSSITINGHHASPAGARDHHTSSYA